MPRVIPENLYTRFGKSVVQGWARRDTTGSDAVARITAAIEDADALVISTLIPVYTISDEDTSKLLVRAICLKAALILRGPDAAQVEDGAADQIAEDYDETVALLLQGAESFVAVTTHPGVVDES